MLNQLSCTDTYDCEKLRILQSLNEQIETMAIKLDQIVSHAEQVYFKMQPNNQSQVVQTVPSYNTLKLNNQENRPSNHILVTMNDVRVSSFFQVFFQY